MVLRVLTTYKIHLMVSWVIVVYKAMLCLTWIADNCRGLGFKDRPGLMGFVLDEINNK